MRTRPGVSLVEIAVVLLVIGISAAAVAPALMSAEEPDNPALIAAIDVANVLRRARATAVERAQVVRVTLHPVTGHYRMTDRDGAEVAAGIIRFPANTTVHTERERIVLSFSPVGSAFGNEVSIRAPSSIARLRVDAWSGAVVIDAE